MHQTGYEVYLRLIVKSLELTVNILIQVSTCILT